jgi:hypothetical protein
MGALRLLVCDSPCYLGLSDGGRSCSLCDRCYALQIKSVEGAGADSAATNGGQVFYVHGDFYGINDHASGRLIVAYGPSSTSKYIAGACVCDNCQLAVRVEVHHGCSAGLFD